MLSVSKHVLKARTINTVFGNITPEKALEIESEYRKTGEVKASTILNLRKKVKRIKGKKRYEPTRQDVSLRDFQEHKRDINYLVSELSEISSCRNKNVSYDSDLINYTTDVAYKINYCLQSLYVDPNTKRLRAPYRCKNHACPYCNHVKQSIRQNEFKEGLKTINIDHLDYKYSSFITVSFKKKASNHIQAKLQIKELNKAISKILGYRLYRNIITGSVRSIEIIETEKTKQAHVHLHMLALVNRLKVISEADLAFKLRELTGQSVRVHIKNKLKPSDSEEAINRLTEGFNYMHKTFGLKSDDRLSESKIFGDFSSSSVRRQSIEFYLIMLRAIKGQRLYNSTGIFRQILKAGRLEFKAKSSYVDYDHPLRTDKPLVHLYWSKKPTYIKEHNCIYDLGSYKISSITLENFMYELDILGLPVRAKVYEPSRVLTQSHVKTFIYDKTSPPDIGKTGDEITSKVNTQMNLSYDN